MGRVDACVCAAWRVLTFIWLVLRPPAPRPRPPAPHPPPAPHATPQGSDDGSDATPPARKPSGARTTSTNSKAGGKGGKGAAAGGGARGRGGGRSGGSDGSDDGGRPAPDSEDEDPEEPPRRGGNARSGGGAGAASGRGGGARGGPAASGKKPAAGGRGRFDEDEDEDSEEDGGRGASVPGLCARARCLAVCARSPFVCGSMWAGRAWLAVLRRRWCVLGKRRCTPLTDWCSSRASLPTPLPPPAQAAMGGAAQRAATATRTGPLQRVRAGVAPPPSPPCQRTCSAAAAAAGHPPPEVSVPRRVRQCIPWACACVFWAIHRHVWGALCCATHTSTHGLCYLLFAQGFRAVRVRLCVVGVARAGDSSGDDSGDSPAPAPPPARGAAGGKSSAPPPRGVCAAVAPPARPCMLPRVCVFPSLCFSTMGVCVCASPLPSLYFSPVPVFFVVSACTARV